MKVCIVGSGSQGTGLAGLLSMEADVERIVIADVNRHSLETAQSLIKGLGDRVRTPRIDIETVNAGSEDDVARVIRGCDVVFNGIIPRFNLPIMRACLRERAHYLDLFANPYAGGGIPYEETITAQLDLDSAFREAGITALPSVGMSPGWTSLSAQYMIDQMDSVDEVIIRWGDYIDTDEFIAPISPVTIYHEWFGAPYPTRTVDGHAEEVDLLASEESFVFPDPIGERKIYTVTAHPDIVLIPRFSDKPVHICEEKGGIYLGRMDTKDMWIKGIQAATVAQGDKKSELNMLEAFAGAFIKPMEYGRLLREGKIRDHAVCFSCEARGRKDGKAIRYISYYTSTLEVARKRLYWASPAVYGTVGGMPIELVLMLGRKEIRHSGVFSVGSLGIAEKLNRAMAARGQILSEKIERDLG